MLAFRKRWFINPGTTRTEHRTHKSQGGRLHPKPRVLPMHPVAGVTRTPAPHAVRSHDRCGQARASGSNLAGSVSDAAGSAAMAPGSVPSVEAVGVQRWCHPTHRRPGLLCFQPCSAEGCMPTASEAWGSHTPQDQALRHPYLHLSNSPTRSTQGSACRSESKLQPFPSASHGPGGSAARDARQQV